jgi:hypothetical protein
VSLPHDYSQDLAGIQVPVLLIHERYDRMAPFDVSIAILNHIGDSRLVLLNNLRALAALREALQVDPAGTCAPAGLRCDGLSHDPISPLLPIRELGVSRGSSVRLRRCLRADRGYRRASIEYSRLGLTGIRAGFSSPYTGSKYRARSPWRFLARQISMVGK